MYVSRLTSWHIVCIDILLLLLCLLLLLHRDGRVGVPLGRVALSGLQGGLRSSSTLGIISESLTNYINIYILIFIRGTQVFKQIM